MDQVFSNKAVIKTTVILENITNWIILMFHSGVM